MYVEKVFVYLVLGTMLIMLFRMWRNEVRIRKIEQVFCLLHKREDDVDKTIRAMLDILDKLFKSILEGAKREKERNERREEANRKSEG